MDFDHNHADRVLRRRLIIAPFIIIGAVLLLVLVSILLILLPPPDGPSPYTITMTYVEEQNRTAFFQMTSTAVTHTPVATTMPREDLSAML